MDKSQRILDGADRCVKCGLCLPHCPTYYVSAQESESPRGRISLMQALASGEMAYSSTADRALKHCLSCYACEKICPAHVDYGRLHDLTLEFIENVHPTSGIKKLIKHLSLYTLLTHKQNMRWLYRIIRCYQKIDLGRSNIFRKLLRSTGLEQLEKQCPQLQSQVNWRAAYNVPQAKKQVGLFLGCVGEQLDQQSLQDSIFLLNQLDINVIVPQSQVCCGALYAHHGDLNMAAQLAEENLQAYKQCGVDTIIFTASGCGSYFNNYQDLIGPEKINLRFVDICRYLLDETHIKEIGFNPLQMDIALHEPCTLRNILRDSKSVNDIINLIPEIRLYLLEENRYCCGAAGSKMITQPETANQLRQPKINELKLVNPDYLLTSNIGCALHLQSGIRHDAMGVKVLHPVSLLRQQWPDSNL